MATRTFVDSKGNTWEWDETPEVLAALKVLHETERKHAEEGGDYGVGK
jgi:hypothetical protein